MVGKGGRDRNYLVPRRQHKAYKVKATLPELQFRRSLTRQGRQDSRKAMLTGYLQFHKVKIIPPGQRTTHIGGRRKRTEHLRMPLLNYLINAGSPTQARWLSPLACRVTEPPYYSPFARNGWSRLAKSQHRHGYTGMATPPESPAAWEEGRSSSRGNRSIRRRGVRMLPESVMRRLDALGDLSRAGKRVNGLFRLLESPVVWMEAYANIYANKGATTRGGTPNTLDGFTDERVVNFQTLLKENRYRPKPVRRVSIPKSDGRKRPLGTSTGADKLVQAVVRLILERL